MSSRSAGILTRLARGLPLRADVLGVLARLVIRANSETWLVNARTAVASSAVRVTSRGWLGDVAALGFFFVCVLYFFKGAIWEGMVYYEGDTLSFYYPIIARLDQVLERGAFPLLWSPFIFAGFPLFADGEAGMLYPFNLAMLALLPASQAFVWMRVIRIFMAASFMYAFARSLEIGRWGAVASGLVFAFGSFLVAQMHHTNLSNTAIWLPLILFFVEKALRNSGAKRDLYLSLAGVSLGIQALGVHIQPLLMTLLVMALYVCFRVTVGPVRWEWGRVVAEQGWRHWLKGILLWLERRVTLVGWVLLVVPIVGFSLAAVQLIPLYELSQFSARGQGVSYSFATSYSSTVFNLVSLIFPFFFRSADGSSWSIWGPWEPTVYIGIAPLALALVGVIFARNRYTLFFLVLAVLGFCLSLGAASPLRLHWYLWQIPGFSFLRSPGRFTFLGVFAAAVLVGFGVHWLTRMHGRAKRSGTEQGMSSSLGMWGRSLPVFYLGVLSLLLAGLVLCLTLGRQWLLENESAALSLVRQWYLSVANNPFGISQERVHSGLLDSVNVDNPKTVTSLVLLGGTIVLLLLWFGFRRPNFLWCGLVVILIAVDLIPYGQAFHPAMPLFHLSGDDERISFLRENTGQYRVFNRRLALPLEPNRLLPFRVPAFGGYSSLEPRRHNEYVWWLRRGNHTLLDLAGIRYVIEENSHVPLPSYHGVSLNPSIPLASGAWSNPNSRAAFWVPPTKATSVEVISVLEGAVDVPQGTPVAEIVLWGNGEEECNLLIRAGEHSSEGGYDAFDVRGKVRHSKATVAFTLTDTDRDGRYRQRYLYHASLPLDHSIRVRRVEYRPLHRQSTAALYGLALLDGEEGGYVQVRSNQKYVKVYEDQEAVIYENVAPMPRAFLVHSLSVMEPSARIAAEMAEGGIDVRQAAILEEEPRELGSSGLEARGAVSKALITSYSSQRVVVETECDTNGILILTDSYYPGWVARVDGQAQRIYRADYLFRGVPLTEGRHMVEFVFDPLSLKLGAAISLTMLLLLLAAWGYWAWRCLGRHG
ncbi:MAG: YfhO family protein [Chloroflexota bacterium]